MSYTRKCKLLIIDPNWIDRACLLQELQRQIHACSADELGLIVLRPTTNQAIMDCFNGNLRGPWRFDLTATMDGDWTDQIRKEQIDIYLQLLYGSQCDPVLLVFAADLETAHPLTSHAIAQAARTNVRVEQWGVAAKEPVG